MVQHVQDNTGGEEVATFEELCRRAGIRHTPQRGEIYRVVASTEEHPDAETVYERVRKRIPSLSLDTVYRTLHLFEDHGLVTRVSYPGDRARFDANSDHHHHFVCTECGLISDFYSAELDRFSPPKEVSDVGEVTAVRVELRGVCKACRKKQTRKS
jgi:Fur family peroxide stress response transcriptional regulator